MDKSARAGHASDLDLTSRVGEPVETVENCTYVWHAILDECRGPCIS